MDSIIKSNLSIGPEDRQAIMIMPTTKDIKAAQGLQWLARTQPELSINGRIKESPGDYNEVGIAPSGKVQTNAKNKAATQSNQVAALVSHHHEKTPKNEVTSNYTQERGNYKHDTSSKDMTKTATKEVIGRVARFYQQGGQNLERIIKYQDNLIYVCVPRIL